MYTVNVLINELFLSKLVHGSYDVAKPLKNSILVKAIVFPVVMYGCESWMKKAECRRIDALSHVLFLCDLMACSLPGFSVHGI